MADILQTVLPLILRHALDKRDRQRRAKLEEQQLVNAQLQQQLLAHRLSEETDPALQTAAFEKTLVETDVARQHARSLKTQTNILEQTGKKPGTGGKSAAEEERDAAAYSRLTAGMSREARGLLEKMKVAPNPDSLIDIVRNSDPGLIDEIEMSVGTNMMGMETKKQPDLTAKGGTRTLVEQSQPDRNAARVIADNILAVTGAARSANAQERATSMVATDRVQKAQPGTIELGDELDMMAPGSPAQLTDLLGTILTSGKTSEGRAKLRGAPFAEPDRGFGGMFGPQPGTVPQEGLPALQEKLARAQGDPGRPNFEAPFGRGGVMRPPPGPSVADLAENDYMTRVAAEQIARKSGFPMELIGGKKLAPSLQGLQALPLSPDDLARLGEAWPKLSTKSKNTLSALVFQAEFLSEDQKKRAAEVVQRTLGLERPLQFAGQTGFDTLKQTLLSR